ncbi:hypothetical protein D3C75_1034270 [compost metagenome]
MQRVVGQVLQRFGAYARFAAFASLAQRFYRGQVVVDFALVGGRQAFVVQRRIKRVVQSQMGWLRFVVEINRFQGQRRFGA